MSLDKIINMIISRVLRTVVNKGVDTAIDAFAGGKKDERPSPEQQDAKRRAKQAMRVARRAGRM